MYLKDDICAAVVTYNPSRQLEENVLSLSAQTGRVIIFDNNSSLDESISILNELSQRTDITIFHEESNMGIPYCLNKALDYCNDNGFPLLLTMDQDSVLDDGCVAKMLDVLNGNDQIKSVGPNYLNKKIAGPFSLEKFLITSGNLVDVKVAAQSGGYYSDLFIDYVDIEFSLKIREAGYLCAIAGEATMLHKIGEYEQKRILFFKRKYLSHSPERFYYAFRNAFITFKLHKKTFFFYCLKMMILQHLELFKILFEKNCWKKLKKSFKGIGHGIRYKVHKQPKKTS